MPELFYTPDLSGLDLLFTQDFSADELAQRRGRLAEAIGPDAKALILSAPPQPSEGMNAQDASFYYLTGLETCHSYLLIDGGTGRSRVFMPSRTTMPGEDHNKLGHEDADLIKDRLKFDHVAPGEQLTEALRGTETIFTILAEWEGGGADFFGANGAAKRRAAEEWDAAEPRAQRIERLLKEKLPGVTVEDVWPHIRDMRTIKSRSEIALLRQAGRLAAAACVEGMKRCKPGMNEADLQAVGEHTYRTRGHCGAAYGWIVASGQRTWDGHYHYNNATIQDGQVVLMDCGPDLRHYTSDIARLFPANGSFSDWHRRIYGFIAEYHKALMAQVKPGVLPTEVYDRAEATMARLCIEPDTPYHDMKKHFEQMVEKGVRYLNHGVGMSVHDPLSRWRDVPLREGFVVVCDPMVWVEETHEYIRTEDTLVVTADGCESLTRDAPFEIDEIEALMR